MNPVAAIEDEPKVSQRDGVCFCRVCKGLLICYLACLAVPLMLLIGVLALVLTAIFA